MSSRKKIMSEKRWAVIVSALLYVLFTVICLAIAIKEERSYTAAGLALLFTIFLFSNISSYMLNRRFINSAYRKPILALEKALMWPKDEDKINLEGCIELDNLVMAINNKVFKNNHEAFEARITKNNPNALVVLDELDNILFSNLTFDTLFSFERDVNRTTRLNDAINKSAALPLCHNIIRIKLSNGNEHCFQEMRSEFKESDVTYTVCIFQNIDEIVSLKEKLDSRFKIDELTSLYTRFHFNELTEEVLGGSSIDDSNYLALIDINDFKILNDSAGHDVGDLILMELANIIRSHSDDEDLLGRISGDEFAILFKNKGIEAVESKLISLYKAIKSYRIEHFETEIGVSVSIGVSKAVGGARFIGMRGLLQQADLAVMTAKKNGFMFKLYDEKDTDIVFYREAPIWINRIKNAISHDNFEIFVQEISPFSEKKDLHLEVLLRMKNEKGGHFPPNKFFEVAEKFNLTKQIDEWVVINTFKKIVDGTFSTCKISINLSGDTIKDRNAVDKILHYAKFYNIDASKVLFEITETMAIDDLNQAISNINTMRIFGFSIALDDFGSGFSTFKYIQNIPADYIKIDGIFVKNACNNERDRAIVSNIVSIAHELNMACVAEFVENKDTMQLMRELEVDYIQGYYVHRPIPAEDWIDESKNRLEMLA